MNLKPKANVPESPRARRIRKAVQVTGTQLMPKLCKISFWCMILLTALTMFLDLVTHMRYFAAWGVLRVLAVMSQSALMTWGFFGVITVVASFVQLQRLRRGHVETVHVYREVGDSRDPFEEVANPEGKYYKYIRVAVVGIAVVLVLFGIFTVLYQTG